MPLPWTMLRDWIRDADLLAGYDGTFDRACPAVGEFDEILGTRGDADLERGRDSASDWILATALSIVPS